MKYYIEKTLRTDFESAVTRTKEALEKKDLVCCRKLTFMKN